MTGAQRRKALEGRVLELAEITKIGRGESLVRKAELNKAAKRVRLGIEAKQKVRMKQKLEEVCYIYDYGYIVTLSNFAGEGPRELPSHTQTNVRRRGRVPLVKARPWTEDGCR